MKILQVKNVEKFQEAPEWLPGCFYEAPIQSDGVIEYFRHHLPEVMHPFFRLVQGEGNEKPILFILSDEEDVAVLGGHEVKYKFFEENKDILKEFSKTADLGKYALRTCSMQSVRRDDSDLSLSNQTRSKRQCHEYVTQSSGGLPGDLF